MDRFDSLRLFVRIVEQGSFTRAAADLSIPRATATHAIKALEERLGARLLERTTRKVTATLDGQQYYQRCQRILAELDAADEDVARRAREPEGTLRLDLHGSHASCIVLPHIDSFQRLYPRIHLVVGSGDRLVDLVAEGVDCVIRSGMPEDSSLSAKPLALIPEVTCASPEYLQRYGRSQHPDELTEHLAVGFFASHQDRRYPFEFLVDGAVRRVELASRIDVNHADSYLACALRGCGLIQLPRYRVERQLASGELVEVLAAYPSPGLPVHALYPRHRQQSRRVRVFIDWVSQIYAQRFGPLDRRQLQP